VAQTLTLNMPRGTFRVSTCEPLGSSRPRALKAANFFLRLVAWGRVL